MKASKFRVFPEQAAPWKTTVWLTPVETMSTLVFFASEKICGGNLLRVSETCFAILGAAAMPWTSKSEFCQVLFCSATITPLSK